MLTSLTDSAPYLEIDGIANQIFSVSIARNIENYRMDSMVGNVFLE